MDLKIFEKLDYPNLYKNRKNDTYAVSINLGRDVLTGKQINTTRKGIPTIREAKAILKDVESHIKMKMALTNNTTFESAYLMYIEECKITKMAQSTIDNKKMRFNKYLLPHLKGIKLCVIDDRHVKAIYQHLADNINISDTTKCTIIKQLSAFFNWCILKKIIKDNPCRYFKNFKPDTKKFYCWNIDEYNQFIATVNKESNFRSIITKTIVSVIYWGGFRIGEVLALTRNDINLEEDYIDINKSLYYGKKGYVLKDTKTEGSNNKVYMNHNILKLIIEYMEFIEGYIGYEFKDTDFIFLNPKRGTVWNEEYIRDIFDFYIDKSGVKRIRIHDLRHSHAALLLSEGFELFDVKERLRHTKIATTSDIYGHLDVKRKKEIANLIEKLES